MFVVECRSPLDEQWEERDLAILASAGRKADLSGTSGFRGRGVREHSWLEATFEGAQAMKRALEAVPGVTVATVREHVTAGGRPA